MTIFRVQHNKNYTTVNNTICKDNRISWKAKGIWLYAFSRPDTWQFHLNDLINHSTDGKDAVTAGLKELEHAGYLKRSRIRDENGLLGKSEWTFHEIPFTDTYEPKPDYPILDKPILDNPPLVNTENIINTEEQQQAVVFSCLEDIEIPSHEKQWLSKNFPEKHVINAIKWVTHPETKINQSLIQAIKWAVKAKPDVPVDKSLLQVENKKHAMYLEGKIASEGAGYNAGPQYVEIFSTRDQSLPICINYTELGFKEQLNSALKKKNFYEVKEIE